MLLGFDERFYLFREAFKFLRKACRLLEASVFEVLRKVVAETVCFYGFLGKFYPNPNPNSFFCYRFPPESMVRLA
jgi:hypothetical protein